MNPRRIVSALVAGVAVLGAVVALQPVKALAQGPAPLVRPVRFLFVPTDRRAIPKAHMGLYALAEYSYAGGKETITRRNRLVMEEDMNLGSAAYAAADVRLPTGEYEVHLVPDNSRTIVKRFIVNNLASSAITVRLDAAPVEGAEERKKVELVRIGTSLAELEARIAALAKQNADLAAEVADLKKRVPR